jgi:hypothetical protein
MQDLCLDCDVEHVDEGPGSFLSCMAAMSSKLQHLTRLEVSAYGWQWPPAGPAYSALTANSMLVELNVLASELPPGIWPYVFPSTQKLAHLTSLELRDSELLGSFDESPRWGAADLSSLASCCPSLCAIDILSLHPGPHVSELRKLTALTRVDVWRYSDDLASVAESVRGLASVTQLRSLHISSNVAYMPVASLLPLTSLTALTKLDCSWYPGGLPIPARSLQQVSNPIVPPLAMQTLHDGIMHHDWLVRHVASMVGPPTHKIYYGMTSTQEQRMMVAHHTSRCVMWESTWAQCYVLDITF